MSLANVKSEGTSTHAYGSSPNTQQEQNVGARQATKGSGIRSTEAAFGQQQLADSSPIIDTGVARVSMMPPYLTTKDRTAAL